MAQLSKARLSWSLNSHIRNKTRRGESSASSARRQPMPRVSPLRQTAAMVQASQALLHRVSKVLTCAQRNAAKFTYMNFPALTGFGAGLVVAGAFAVALTHVDHAPATDSGAQTASMRSVSGSTTENAKQVYSNAK